MYLYGNYRISVFGQYISNPGMVRRSQYSALEEQLLLLCTTTRLGDAEVECARALTEQGHDWEHFVRLALAHGVGGIVYKNLSQHFSAAVPAGIMAHLKRYAIVNTQSNMSLLKELHEIHRLLSDNHIRHAVFKGLIINQLIYHDFSIRRCGDIDLLVGVQDFPRAKALFLSQGFQQTLPDSEEALYLQSGLWHEGRRLKVDLHWGIPPQELGIRADALMANLAAVSLDGGDAPSFIPEDMLIVLCVNAVKEYWNQMLYTYCDIHEFLESDIQLNWELLFKRAKVLRCIRPLKVALNVVKELYGMPVPDGIVKKIELEGPVESVKNELINSLFDSDARDMNELRLNPRYVLSHRDYLSALMDGGLTRFRYRYLMHLEPTASDTKVLNLPDSLYFLYYFIRPVRVTGKYGLRALYWLAGRRFD